MPKKCPPGVFCIENYTILFFIFVICSILFFMWNTGKNNQSNNDLANNVNNLFESYLKNLNNFSTYTKPSYSYTDNMHDVLMNPYSAPLRDDRPIIPPPTFGMSIPTQMQPMGGDIRGIPINIPTQGVYDAPYRQVGILTRINGPEMILPLMGRPTLPGRDKWNFYTMSDKNNMIKLPISFQSKNCTGEYGCDNVSNGDTVYVEGYNDAFKVTSYENNTLRYIPYI